MKAPKNISVTFGSIGSGSIYNGMMTLSFNDVDIDALIEEIGLDYIMDAYELAKKRFD